MMARRKWAVGIAAVLAPVAAGWFYLAGWPGSSSAAVTDIDAGSLAAFRDEFNRAAGNTRIILLLSPT
ncbi:MAG: hypothetical protein ACRD8O_12265 [Bryobacteraceae bacterium]